MAYEIGFTDQTGTTGFAHKELLLRIQALAELNGWTTLRYSTASSASHELILQGEGLSGDKSIIIGFRTYESVVSDYYNICAAAMIGYVPGNTWASQPGMRECGIPAHNQFVDYYLQVNPGRIHIGVKVGTPVYEVGGGGLLLSFPLDASDIPPPDLLYVAGMLDGAAATRYSDIVHSMPWKGNRQNFKVRNPAGVWVTPEVWPWNNAWIGGATTQLRDTNSVYPIERIVVNDSTPNIYGIVDGIGYVSNFNNTVESMVQEGGTPVTDNPLWTTSERASAIITAGGTPWLCLQDVGRTSFNDYFAMRLS